MNRKRIAIIILLISLMSQVCWSREYVGTLYVGDSYKQEKTRVKIIFVKGGGVTLRLFDVKFSRWMPVRVDFDIPDVKDEEGSLKAEKTVPLVDGKPYPKKTITDLRGKHDAKRVSFNMKVGDSTLKFSGERSK